MTTTGTPLPQIEDDMNALLQEGVRVAEELLNAGEGFKPFGVARGADGVFERAELTAGEQTLTVTSQAAHTGLFQAIATRRDLYVGAAVVSDMRASTEDGVQTARVVLVEIEHHDEAAPTLTALVTYTRDEATGAVTFADEPQTQPGERRIWV